MTSQPKEKLEFSASIWRRSLFPISKKNSSK